MTANYHYLQTLANSDALGVQAQTQGLREVLNTATLYTAGYTELRLRADAKVAELSQDTKPIAHDFAKILLRSRDNLIGFCALALGVVPNNSPLHRTVTAINKSAKADNDYHDIGRNEPEVFTHIESMDETQANLAEKERQLAEKRTAYTLARATWSDYWPEKPVGLHPRTKHAYHDLAANLAQRHPELAVSLWNGPALTAKEIKERAKKPLASAAEQEFYTDLALYSEGCKNFPHLMVDFLGRHATLLDAGKQFEDAEAEFQKVHSSRAEQEASLRRVQALQMQIMDPEDIHAGLMNTLEAHPGVGAVFSRKLGITSAAKAFEATAAATSYQRGVSRIAAKAEAEGSIFQPLAEPLAYLEAQDPTIMQPLARPTPADFAGLSKYLQADAARLADYKAAYAAGETLGLRTIADPVAPSPRTQNGIDVPRMTDEVAPPSQPARAFTRQSPAQEPWIAETMKAITHIVEQRVAPFRPAASGPTDDAEISMERTRSRGRRRGRGGYSHD